MRCAMDKEVAAEDKTTVMVAVRPGPLSRVVEHLLRDCPEMQIVARPSEFSGLASGAARLLPDVIITNERLLGREPDQAVTEVRRRSPESRVIVLRPGDGVAAERRCGANGYVSEQALVRRLIRTVRRMARGLRVG